MESNKYIIVKFSELFLKGNNKKEFIKVLIKNIQNKLIDKKIIAEVKNMRDRIKIISEDLDSVLFALREIVGISFFSKCFEIKFDKKNIEKIIEEELSNYHSGSKFRVSAKLINSKTFDKKEDLIDWLALFGVNKMNFKIDLKNYDIDFNIKLENEIAIISFFKEEAINGLPSGSNGKALALLSGGIDSPVAAFKTITRGINVSFITFLTPLTSENETISKIKELALEVDKYNGNHGKLFFVNFEKVQEEIMKIENSSYRIILLRRYFMRFSELVSKKYGYKFFITGDSLGQVASQTPESMTQINNATKKLIIRPLVSMSKNEIIKEATSINTYKISIKPGNDMCSAFTPKKPILFPKEKIVKELEEKLINMDYIMEQILEKDTRIIELKELLNVKKNI